MVKTNKKLKANTIKKALLGVGIAILFTLFVFYAIQTIYTEPKYENYCNIS